MIQQEKGQNQNKFFRQLFFIFILAAIAFVIWGQLGFFLSSFLGAITLYVVLRKPLLYLINKRKWKSWQASALLIILTTVFLFSIGFLVFEVIASEASSVNLSNISAGIGQFIDKMSAFTKHPFFPKEAVGKAEGLISSLLSILFSTTYSFVLNFLMMIVVLYFMFANTEKMEKTILEYSPFQGDSMQMIKHAVKSMIFSNAVGIPIIMVVQASVSMLAYWLLGFDDVLFWGFLTAILGLVPLLGTAGVWLPLAISLFVNGNTWQGVVLVIYGIFIISNSDNACRLILMKKMANTSPLIIVFGVILGIPLFGFWGIIFGPLLISGFLLLLKIYHKEYGDTQDKITSKEEN